MHFFKRKSSPTAADLALIEMKAIAQNHVIVRFDRTGVILDVNDNFCAFTGFSREEVIGANYAKIIRPKDRNSEEYRELWRKLATGEPVNMIVPRLNKSGEEIWFDVTYTPLTDAEGNPLHVIAVAREISAHHFRRRDNRSQVDAIKRSMAVVEFDLKGVVTDANSLFLETMGYSLDEIKGQHHRKFMDPGEAASADYAAFWQRLAVGSSEKGQVKRIDKSGKTRWLEATYETVKDPEGRPFKVVKYAFDITDAKNLAADAASQIAAIQKVQAVIEFDPSGKILRANDNFCKVMGYTSDEIVGRSHSIFVPQGYAASPDYKTFWENLRNGISTEDKFLRYGKNGREVHIRASYNPIRDAAGHVVKVVKFAIDTTIFQITADTMRHGLEQLAAGDLTIRLTQDLGELDAVRVAFNDAAEKVRSVLSGVIDSSRQIHSEVGLISDATNELSRRTEHQAATLEESAAALDQLTASVKSAAHSASDAKSKAARAKSETERSGQIVGDAVKAMDEIAQSSNKISSITNVIDEIAFQTNLLALNAGVEAARAGDAGRGFAVVASEVRALAQRSSDAAREIAELISASTTQVKKGVELVGEAGKTLTVIDSTVNDIHESIVQIATSAQEQATGLSEMNVAVNQLDQATQRNAAMAEETNAAVQNLSQGVADMQNDVSYFATEVAAKPAPSSKGVGFRRAG